jgi:hypothetical protein
MKKCAYCGDLKSALTLEHVFPASLDKEFRKDGDSIREAYWIERLDKKMVGGQPTIKDVCQECNNGVLSQLDSYGVSLYQKYFCRIAEENGVVKFEYDYDLLLRWILKLSYNSARVNKANDLEHLQKYRWYVLDRHKRPSRLALYLTLVFKHEIDEKTRMLANEKLIEMPEYHSPDMLRIGRFEIQNPDWAALISRTAIFQSFFFSIFSLNEKTPASAFLGLNELFRKFHRNAVLVAPDRKCVQINAGMSSQDAINSHIMVNAPYYAKKFPDLFSE